jgi:hypothetical protein
VFEVPFANVFSVLFSVLVASSIMVLLLSSQALCREELIVGAKLVKETDVLFPKEPEVEFLTNDDKCELLKEEKYYGENVREFFFNVRIRAEGESYLPRAKVLCPADQVKFVIVGRDYVSYQRSEDVVIFDLTRNTADPLSAITHLDYGKISMNVQHNLEIKKAGKYKDRPWSDRAAKAHLNFLFASRELAREMGFQDADFDNKIAIYGFDGNYPRGHIDFPPHFHFFIAWSDFGKSRVTHFDLDDEGRIIHNRFHCGVTRTTTIYGKGEVCTQYSPDGKLNFEMMVTDEGGLMVRKAEGEQEYFFKPDSETGHFYTAVEIFKGKEKLSRVSVDDDPERGEMTIEVTPHKPHKEKALTKVETVKYDPDIPSKFSLSK